MNKNQQISGHQMRAIAQKINKEVNGLGFCLLVFPFSQDGPVITNYISNARREDMIKALEETLERWKNNQDFQTPEKN